MPRYSSPLFYSNLLFEPFLCPRHLHLLFVLSVCFSFSLSLYLVATAMQPNTRLYTMIASVHLDTRVLGELAF